MLAGVAVDAVFDSVSVATTFKEQAGRGRASSSARSPRRCRSTPSWCKKYLGIGGAATRQLLRRAQLGGLHRRLVLYIPKGVRCPMELSTYFRINAANTGQFERTLIVAEEGAYVSYLEGCTAPMRDENQLHAAVVELVALDERARSSTRPCRTGTPATRTARAASTTSSPSAACAEGRNSKISWTQVETGSAITWKYPSCILQGRRLGRRVLLGGADQQPPAGRHRHQDDPHRQEHPQHHRLEGHLGRPRPEHLPRPGEDPARAPTTRATTRSATRC